MMSRGVPRGGRAPAAHQEEAREATSLMASDDVTAAAGWGVPRGLRVGFSSGVRVVGCAQLQGIVRSHVVVWGVRGPAAHQEEVREATSLMARGDVTAAVG